MNKKPIFIGIVISLLFTTTCFAKIESKEDADEFLKKYCIDIVATIENQYEEQKKIKSHCQVWTPLRT